jgi:SSS family solute:Na+ symporter
VHFNPEALRYVAFSPDAKAMAEDMYRAMWSCSACVLVTVAVSLMTQPKPVTELEGLVYGASKIPEERDEHWYQKPILWASAVAAVFVVLNIIFW